MSHLDMLHRLASRRALHDATLSREQRIERAIANTGVTVLLLWLAALAVSGERFLGLDFWETLLAGGIMLGVLIAWRQRWTKRRERTEGAIAWLEQARQRLDEDRFLFGQDDGSQYRSRTHPNASDLNLFGSGSLYERLNSCATVLGRDALAAMLSGDLPGPDPRARQHAIEELRDSLEQRETLALELQALSAIGPRNLRERALLEQRTRALLDWGGEESEAGVLRPGPVTCRILAALAATAVVACTVFSLPASFIVPFYAINAVFLARAKRVGAMLEPFEMVRDTLGAWIRVLRTIEAMPARDPLLRDICGRLRDGELNASATTVQLKRLVDQLSQRRNTLWAATFDVILLWDLRVCRALERWRTAHGARLRAWLQAAARIEALCALATYAEAVPDAVFAQVDEDGPVLNAEDLTHPLLPRETRVGNTVAFAEPGQLWIVTGSNMSGKSTYLRTAGLAVVMGHLGVPVPARSLRMRPMRVVTCMQVEDSLQEASSLFHAEVHRLKNCLDWAAGCSPETDHLTLVLLDEILAGTNSRERHLGALAILRSLARLPMVGLVSTHDLGLTRIADEMPERTRIVHFCDQVRDGRMTFDYVLRPGPLPSTNALRVMRLAGLDVPDDDA